MANVYARIDSGNVAEVIKINDGEPPLSDRYHAAMLENFIELTGAMQFTIKPGWNYDGMGFSQPSNPAKVELVRYVPVSVVRERMEEINKWNDLVAILQQDMANLIKVLTLQYGLDPNDQNVRGAIAATGADPDQILAE